MRHLKALFVEGSTTDFHLGRTPKRKNPGREIGAGAKFVIVKHQKVPMGDRGELIGGDYRIGEVPEFQVPSSAWVYFLEISTVDFGN